MVRISGVSKSKRKIEKASRAIARELGIKSQVNLRFLDVDNPDTYGFASNISGSHYVCIFKDCPDDKLAEVIAHEMVHVAQNDRGDLVFDYDNMIFYWKGEKYTQEDLDQMEYYDRPWEAEAKKLEKDLAKDFFMS